MKKAVNGVVSPENQMSTTTHMTYYSGENPFGETSEKDKIVPKEIKEKFIDLLLQAKALKGDIHTLTRLDVRLDKINSYSNHDRLHVLTHSGDFSAS